MKRHLPYTCSLWALSHEPFIIVLNYCLEKAAVPGTKVSRGVAVCRVEWQLRPEGHSEGGVLEREGTMSLSSCSPAFPHSVSLPICS